MSQLEELRKLKAEYIGLNFFESLLDLEVWSTQVSSLINFDLALLTKFKSHSSSGYISWRTGNVNDAKAHIKNAATVLDQAIILCENTATKETENKHIKQHVTSELEFPKKVTLKWLYLHVEVKHWVLAITILLSVFSAGIWLGQSNVYKAYTTITESKVSNK